MARLDFHLPSKKRDTDTHFTDLVFLSRKCQMFFHRIDEWYDCEIYKHVGLSNQLISDILCSVHFLVFLLKHLSVLSVSHLLIRIVNLHYTGDLSTHTSFY